MMTNADLDRLRYPAYITSGVMRRGLAMPRRLRPLDIMACRHPGRPDLLKYRSFLHRIGARSGGSRLRWVKVGGGNTDQAHRDPPSETDVNVASRPADALLVIARVHGLACLHAIGEG
jgi:hypothetical protein